MARDDVPDHVPSPGPPGTACRRLAELQANGDGVPEGIGLDPPRGAGEHGARPGADAGDAREATLRHVDRIAILTEEHVTVQFHEVRAGRYLLGAEGTREARQGGSPCGVH